MASDYTRSRRMDFMKDDERRLEASEMWFYVSMLRISWVEKRTNHWMTFKQDANSLPKLSKEKCPPLT